MAKREGHRMDKNKLPILLLAAGASSRMQGRDKLAETVEDRPLLRLMAERALATGHPVHVTLPSLSHPRATFLDGLDLTLTPVPDSHEGINASLRSGVRSLSDGAEAVMVVLADLPELTTDHLQSVFAARVSCLDATVWRGATKDRAPGHPTLIDRSLFDDILQLEGDEGAQPILRSAKTVLVPLPEQAARRDLDTPEDWARWRLENCGKP